MPGNWPIKKLGDFVTLQRGHDLPDERRVAGEVPVIGSFGITGWHNEARSRGPGVTVGRSGASFGVVSYSPIDFWPLNTALYVIDFHGNDPKFSYYFLHTFDFGKFNSGSAQPSLNRNFIHPVEVCVPPPAEQVAIARLLGSLDDKIELNRRMAETLEAMARALFQSWFVDFDPVNARGQGGQPGLFEDLAALFPDSLEADGVPAEWFRVSLGNLVSIERATQDPMVLGKTLVDHFSLPAFDAGQRPVREPASDIKSLKVSIKPPLVLFSKLNPETPRVWPVLAGTGETMLASTEFLAIRPRPNRAPLSFVASLLASNAFRDKAAGMVTGTSKSHQRVQPGALLESTWIVPTASVLAAFDEIASPMLSRAEAARNQSDTLAALRDILLPKLISGELRIADAENRIAAA